MRALSTMPQEHFEAAVGLVMSHHPGLQVGAGCQGARCKAHSLAARRLFEYRLHCQAGQVPSAHEAPLQSLLRRCLQAYDDFGFDLDALDALSLRQMQVGMRLPGAVEQRALELQPEPACSAPLAASSVPCSEPAQARACPLCCGPLQSFVKACEAAAADARDRGAPPPAGAVSWPQLLLGAGLRPYRPPKGSRRLRRTQRGQAAAKREEQQRGDMPPPAAVQPGQRRPLAEVVADAPPPPSTLTPEEVAAAAAAAGMMSPLLPPAVLPPAGSAVAPKGLGPAAGPVAGTAAGSMPPPPAAVQQQQHAAQRQQQPKLEAAARVAAPVVGSNTPVAPLGPATAPAQPDGSTGPLPVATAAQMAAVAASTPQEQQLLSQMHNMLAAAAQAAAGSKVAPGQKPGTDTS